VLGQSPLIDARVDADRRNVELPLWLRVRSWWRRQMSQRIEDGIRDLGATRSPVRMVAPILIPILSVPAVVILREPGNQLALWCLLSGAAALVYALVSDAVEQRLRRTSWIQTLNVVVYATIITLLLATFVAYDHPHVHLHWVIFCLYFLLLGSVGLTDDPRQGVVAGGISIAGYCAVIVFAQQAAAAGNATADRLLPEFEWVANSAKLAMLAGASVMAVASAERGRELHRLSLRDGLTGLLNRRAFEDCIGRLAERAVRDDTALTIAVIDIDHFKQLNDEHGHATGDVVLRWLATRIERSFRASDLVARYGGAEFVVALPDSGDARVIERLEVLRAHVATSVLRERRAEQNVLELRIRVSIGVAELPADGSTPAQALVQAHARLQQAKAAGRNRIHHGRR
jgi:diguanylate cyclase (GGDEF)-like protein